LSNVDAAEKAVDDKKDEPEKHSKDWVEQTVESMNRPLESVLENIEVTQEDISMVEDTLQTNDALEYWHDYVAPDVKYRSKAKKAILIMLASPRDKYGNKGRVNVFMYGEPGTGKSVFKSFLKDNFKAVTIDGPRASSPDLTYNKSTEEMGKLPEAHKGVLVVEEADEMDEDILGSTLTSFGETGRIEIRDMEIPAKARGVMLSNFESRQEIINQWSPESLNRFDFTIYFDNLDNEQKSDTLDWHYEHFRKPNPSDSKNILKKYVKIVRSHTPDIAEPDSIKKYKDDRVDQIENVREGVSIMNIAWTIARLNLDDVKLKHYKKAFNLTTDEKSLKDKFSS
jgi:DNA replicative helicase MCM subunit Mcm2 (Cdc46/Mcm family)